MSSLVWTGRPEVSSIAGQALKFAARSCFVTLVLGQWIFVGHALASPRGSFAVAAHLIVALIVVVGGPLQFIPELRRHAPRLHHWNGRVYMLAVFALSATGVHMVWTRQPSNLVPQISVSFHAALILSFAALALRAAIRRDVSSHRRWALRMWMTLNAGWLFRMAMTRRILLDDGAVGSFLSAMSLTDYVLPLIILEIYLRRNDASMSGRLAIAAVILVMTATMGVGFLSAALETVR